MQAERARAYMTISEVQPVTSEDASGNMKMWGCAEVRALRQDSPIRCFGRLLHATDVTTPNMQRSSGNIARDITGVRLHRGRGHSLMILRRTRDLR